ncbi:hypothetical protein ACQ9BO_12620 [Flavobacterium sp. P21]|uniref:hypothetical protein n=1 Tax=Flavobacterium sp. P21 TaxID=3423948 RepID=UPI003D6709C2
MDTSAKGFNFRDKSKFKKTIISNEVFIIEFHEKTQVLSSIKTVFYVLRFENNLLEGYTFKIPVDKNEDGTEFFNNMLKKIDKTKNNFIDSEEKLAYMKMTNDCKRFFRFTGSEIFGGIHNKP